MKGRYCDGCPVVAPPGGPGSAETLVSRGWMVWHADVYGPVLVKKNPDNLSPMLLKPEITADANRSKELKL